MIYTTQVAVTRIGKTPKYIRLVVNATTENECHELVADYVLRKHGSYHFDIVTCVCNPESVLEVS